MSRIIIRRDSRGDYGTTLVRSNPAPQRTLAWYRIGLRSNKYQIQQSTDGGTLSLVIDDPLNGVEFDDPPASHMWELQTGDRKTLRDNRNRPVREVYNSEVYFDMVWYTDPGPLWYPLPRKGFQVGEYEISIISDPKELEDNNVRPRYGVERDGPVGFDGGNRGPWRTQWGMSGDQRIMRQEYLEGVIFDTGLPPDPVYQKRQRAAQEAALQREKEQREKRELVRWLDAETAWRAAEAEKEAARQAVRDAAGVEEVSWVEIDRGEAERIAQQRIRDAVLEKASEHHEIEPAARQKLPPELEFPRSPDLSGWIDLGYIDGGVGGIVRVKRITPEGESAPDAKVNPSGDSRKRNKKRRRESRTKQRDEDKQRVAEKFAKRAQDAREEDVPGTAYNIADVMAMQASQWASRAMISIVPDVRMDPVARAMETIQGIYNAFAAITSLPMIDPDLPTVDPDAPMIPGVDVTLGAREGAPWVTFDEAKAELKVEVVPIIPPYDPALAAEMNVQPPRMMGWVVGERELPTDLGESDSGQTYFNTQVENVAYIWTGSNWRTMEVSGNPNREQGPPWAFTDANGNTVVLPGGMQVRADEGSPRVRFWAVDPETGRVGSMEGYLEMNPEGGQSD